MEERKQKMKYIKNTFFVISCILLCCGFKLGWTLSHNSYFSNNKLLKANADELDTTVVSPHLEIPMNTDKNIVWCSTFQLAWNKACELIGENIHFYQDPPMVEILNKRTVNESNIDEMSYVALAGHIRDDILDKIRKELNIKFKGTDSPQLIPSGKGMRPQDIVTYSYLFKNLEFPQKFEQLNKPINFEQTKVSGFGVGEKAKRGHIQMFSQVSILDYKDPDDFIIELKTNSPIDQVILAKVVPADSFNECIENVLKRMSNGTSVNMQYGDVLKIPKNNFDILRKYSELSYKKLRVKNPKIAKDLFVLSAEQSIRFQLDEEGVKLKSESQVSFGCSKTMEPIPQHIMIFDKPYLVLLKNRDSDVPYFAMWIDNPELLISW